MSSAFNSNQSPSRAPRATARSALFLAAKQLPRLSSQQDCISLALHAPCRDATCVSKVFCPNIQPRAHARLTGLTISAVIPDPRAARGRSIRFSPSDQNGKRILSVNEAAARAACANMNTRLGESAVATIYLVFDLLVT